MENLYGVFFRDRRKRKHVAVVKAENTQQAIGRVVDYQTGRGDFELDIIPDEDDVKKIIWNEDEDDPTCDHVCMVYHDDYD